MPYDQVAQYRQSVRESQHRPAPGAVPAIEAAFELAQAHPSKNNYVPPTPAEADPVVIAGNVSSVTYGAYDGDAQVIPFTTTADADTIIIPRPAGKRVLMIIQVQSGVAATVNFGQSAVGSGVSIAVGGDITLDSVCPQNDVHISSTGGAAVGVAVFVNVPKPAL